jgi:hypothetical protein
MATSYVVTATRLHLFDKDGNRVKRYRGDTVTGLSDADVKRLKAAGAIATHSGDEANAAKADPATPNAAETSDGEPTAPESHDPEGGSASELAAVANSTAPEDDGTGLVTESHDPEGGSASTLMAAANSAPASPPRPAKAADLPTWQAFATANGVAIEDAEGKPKTKRQLIAELDGGDDNDDSE